MQRRRRHPLLRLLGGVVLLLVLLVGAAAGTAALLIDPNTFKPEIEAAAARATGGTLDLRGPIRVAFGLPLRLLADDIVLTGANGAETLRLARLAARVALLPLLTGEVDIVRLDLRHPRLLLTAAAPRAAPPPPPAAPVAPAAVRSGAMHLRLAVGAVHVEDGQVTWRGTTFALPHLDAVAAAPGADLVLSGELVSAGRTLLLSGETGPAERLFDRGATAPWPVQLVLQGEAARLAVRGTLAAPLRDGGYALQVDAAATDLAAFAPLLPMAVPTLHDLSFSARVAGAGRAMPEVSALTLHVAGLDLEAAIPGLMVARADVTAPDLRQPIQADAQVTLRGTSLHVLATAGPLGATLPLTLTAEAPPMLQHLQAALSIAIAAHPAITGTLSAQRLDLDALLAALPPRPPPQAGVPAVAAPRPGPARLIPDRPLDLAPLRAADADLQIAVAAAQTGGLTYADVAAHVRLQNGRLILDPLAARSPGGPLAGRLAVDAGPAAPPVALALHAPSLALGPLAAALGAPGALDGSAAVDADLSAAGATPHALAASLGGHLALSADDADVDNAVLASLLGGVLRAARLPENVLGGAGRTKLRCLDLRLDAQDGTVTVARLVADTPRLLVQGGGSVELGAETLNLRLRPMLRVGPGVVVPVRIGGTLAEPKPALDSGAAGRTALLGALAGVLSGEHGGGGGDPCVPPPATPGH